MTVAQVHKSQTRPAHDEPAKLSMTDPTSKWMNDIELTHADIPILTCCFVSGLCDSVVFSATSVFASMQTGNTIFLALGAARLPAEHPTLWIKALVSIAAYWAGCLLFSQSRHFHPLRRTTLFLSFATQAAFILAAAAVAQAGVVSSFSLSSVDPSVAPADGAGSLLLLLPLALLSFQFGGQIVSSRVLGLNEVPTNVLTSLYCDLLSDAKLLAPLPDNPKRNRRVMAAVLLVAGGISGGWLQRSRAGMTAALWLAGGIKITIALAWLAWRCKGDVNTRARRARGA